MKKTIKGSTAFALAIMMIGTMSVTVFAATAQDVTNKNVPGYTAGTQSVYGPKLTQEQLNAVANVVADFKTNYTNDTMTNDQKIRAGHDYIKNRVTYIDWDKGGGANTAYALVTGQGACSGMTRGFIALMDAVDVKAYLIHADTNDHQWILTEFDDGFAYIDIDANVSSGFEAIYHAKSHPYTYDTNGLPAVGSHSSNYGTKASVTEGWKQEEAGWWYQNADGSSPQNTWQVLTGKWYYFEANGYMAANKWIGGTYYVGADGVMLTNATTPDGYQVDGNGVWVQKEQSDQRNDNSKTYRVYQKGAKTNIDFADGINEHSKELRSGVSCVVIGDNIGSFMITSNDSNIDPNIHKVSVIGFMETSSGLFALIPNDVPLTYDFEYDKFYSLDFSGLNKSPAELSRYCKDNNIIIKIEIIDKTTNSELGGVIEVCYSK